MTMIWSLMLILGTFTLVVTQGGDAAMNALIEGAKEAVTLSYDLVGAYLLFLGLVGIVKRCGLMEKLTRLLRPFTAWLFPKAPQAGASITLTFAANMLGMGNAATPFGLQAMGEMEKTNPHPGRATPEMCTFLCINSSCLQLVPTTLIALRQAAGSASPASILFPCLFASVVSTATALVLCKCLSK